MYVSEPKLTNVSPGRRGKEITGLCVCPNSQPRLRRAACDIYVGLGIPTITGEQLRPGFVANSDNSARRSICKYLRLNYKEKDPRREGQRYFGAMLTNSMFGAEAHKMVYREAEMRGINVNITLLSPPPQAEQAVIVYGRGRDHNYHFRMTASIRQCA